MRSIARLRRSTSALVFILFVLNILALGAAQEYAKLAPFQDIEWPRGYGQPPVVTLNGKTYELLAINRLPIDEIVSFSRCQYGNSWDRRIAEDLVQVLSEIGAAVPGRGVELRVLDDLEEVTLSDVSMTTAKRQAVYTARAKRSSAAVEESKALTPDAFLEDLTCFERALHTQFAYLHANDFDYESYIDALRRSVKEGMSVEEFGLGLQRLLAGFIDGHASVRGFGLPEDLEGFTPFLMGWVGERAVAFKPDRTSFVDEAHPYVVAIDGVPLETWLEAAALYIADGSPQLVRRRALKGLRSIQFYREALGLPLQPDVTLTLTSKEGETLERTLPTRQARPRYGDWPERNSDILEGNIGYLRLESMDEDAVKEIYTWLPRFEKTAGLIVDVRGNGGGDRDALMTLFPHLMREEHAVVNVAKYRLAPKFGEDHLASRFLYRADSPHWSGSEREFVQTFAAAFEPEWRPPEEDFSAWHYLLVSKGDAKPYTAPVVVLLDAGGFSATDIFLGALATLPNVTLVGEASSGGSANTEGVDLPNTGLEVRLASMASFRPDGRLYDGRGVEPDIEVQPAPSFFLQGGEDVVLERAVEVLSDASR